MASDPFFTKKRKRGARNDKLTSRGPQRAKKAPKDVEISSDSDLSQNGNGARNGDDDEDGLDSDADTIVETPAEKRLRIAKAYIERVSHEVADNEGFDAADLDRDLISARLEEDTLATSEKIYLRIAESIDTSLLQPDYTWTKETSCVTSVTAHSTNIYTTFKNGNIQRWSQSEESGTLHLKKTVRRAHAKEILCSALSHDGTRLATGSVDRTIKLWSGSTLAPLQTFSQHRDAVNGLAFSPTGVELYSASSDRTIKLFNVGSLVSPPGKRASTNGRPHPAASGGGEGGGSGSYIETLFGHQDHVSSISSVVRDTCVTTGSRDRTARLWKIPDESQLVFRSVAPYSSSSSSSLLTSNSTVNPNTQYKEGGVDVCAQIDRELFVVGSDNGTLALYSTQKKKALCRIPLVHGVDSGRQVSAEVDVATLGVVSPDVARWITAVACVPFSDLVVTGSWSGAVHVHRVSSDARKLEPRGSFAVGPGVVTDMVFVKDTKQDTKQDTKHDAKLDATDGRDGHREWYVLVCTVGFETRGGRWKTLKRARNAIVRVPMDVLVRKAH